eukprot:855693-Rhodomonas_salina.1
MEDRCGHLIICNAERQRSGPARLSHVVAGAQGFYVWGYLQVKADDVLPAATGGVLLGCVAA